MSQVQERTLISFDWAMKSILRDKANFDVLEGFLSTLLQQEITIISLLESESNQKYDRDKFNRVDLLVHDDQNRVFVVEVQHAREPHHLKRLLYGASKLVVKNIDLGNRMSWSRKLCRSAFSTLPLAIMTKTICIMAGPISTAYRMAQSYVGAEMSKARQPRANQCKPGGLIPTMSSRSTT